LKASLETGAKANRPRAAMKPAALAAAVKAASADYHTQVAETRAATWKTEEESNGRTVTPQALADKKAKLKGDFDTSCEDGAKDSLIRDLGAPEFVIADTNWGDSRTHTFFVIAPDPTTGDPMLWKKTEPPGSLAPAGRDWVDREWKRI
jgi:hypothetical protein